MKKKNVYKIFMIILWLVASIAWVVPDRIRGNELVLTILAIIFTIFYIIKRWQLKKKQIEELSRASTSSADINML